MDERNVKKIKGLARMTYGGISLTTGVVAVGGALLAGTPLTKAIIPGLDFTRVGGSTARFLYRNQIVGGWDNIKKGLADLES